MAKNDSIKKMVKQKLPRHIQISSDALDVLGKDIELQLDPLLGKAMQFAERENRSQISPGDMVKSINYNSGKKSPRILIAHVTAGAGHTRAAQAIEKAFKNLYPDANVKLVDTLDYINSVYKKVYGTTYLALVRHTPKIWGYLYDRFDKDLKEEKLDDKLRQSLENMQAGDFRDFLDDFSPDVVICTHFLPMELISRWKKKRKSSLPLYAVVTDFALHAFWIVEEVDAYFVASPEVCRELQTRGATAQNIYETGIPVDPIFSALPPQEQVREKLGIQQDLSTVLIMAGGYGIGDLVGLVKSFQSVTTPMQLLIVSGKNEGLYQELLQISNALPMPHKIYGFVNNVHELMRASDLVISKPGGLSSSESLASNCPMMIINPIPGQEQRNSDYLLENGAASILHNISDGAYYVENLIKNKERLAYMKTQTQRIGRKEAAQDIAHKVFELAKLEVE